MFLFGVAICFCKASYERIDSFGMCIWGFHEKTLHPCPRALCALSGFLIETTA
jgi:hypothetical protein